MVRDDHCLSGVHCVFCRNPANTAFRASFGRLLHLSGDSWACPHGRPMGYQPPVGSVPLSVDDRRRGRCDGCEWAMQVAGKRLVPREGGRIDGCALAQAEQHYEPRPCDWHALRACPDGRWGDSDLMARE